MIRFLNVAGTAQRLLGVLILLPVIAVIFFNQTSASLVLFVVSIIMGLEARRILPLPPVIGAIVAALIAVTALPDVIFAFQYKIFLGFGIAVIVGATVAVYSALLAAVFAMVLCVCLAFITAMIMQPGGNITLVNLAVIIAACDSAAYFAGRQFGGPKLMPSVSPNKTVSGAVFGLIAAILVAGLLTGLFGGSLGAFLTVPSLLHGVILGAGLGVLSQVGDLFESAVKRKLGVKDSGSILPGHGGLLDRFDGYLLAGPALYLYLYGF